MLSVKIHLLDQINCQPLYENPQEDSLTDSGHLYCRKYYERELSHEKRQTSLQKELEMTRGTCTTPDFRFTSEVPPYLLSGQNITRGSRGKGFIVLFMKSLLYTTKKVYVTSERDFHMNITTSTRLDPSLKIQIDKNVLVNSSHLIILPTAIELNYLQKEVKSVLIETSDDVNVISFDEGERTAGSTAIIPIHKLSTKYIVISTAPSRKSQLAVAAIKDNTTISVTFKMERNRSLKIENITFYRDDVFSFSLDRFETYQIAHSTDLTGSVIESSYPIAAFSGNDCNNIDGIGYCDHLITQLPPTGFVDNMYIVPPNNDDRDTIIRITAIDKSDIFYMIGAANKSLSLYKSNSFDIRISSNQVCYIESTTPVIVTGIGLASKQVLNLGDPSMAIIPGINQYLNYYKIVIPNGYVNNFVSVMIKESSLIFFRINSTVINICDIIFEKNVLAGNITYNVRTIRVTEGVLTALALDGEKFGMVFLGVHIAEAYSFSVNFLLP